MAGASRRAPVGPAASGSADNRLLTVFGEQREALLRFLRRRVGNDSLAEDLAQETWLRAAGSASAGTIEKPRAFLFRIAANLALDHQRHLGHRVELEGADALAARVQDRAPSPETVTSDRREFARLLLAIEGLPPRCREVFLLAKFDALTYAAIAERLGVSRNTVITHMVIALKRLEREMERQPQGPEKG